MAARRTVDLDRLKTMSRNKRTPREIATALNCCVDTVLDWQEKLGLRSVKKRFTHNGCSLDAIRHDTEERDQWKQIQDWPIGIRFDSLSFKPCTQRKPVMPESNSGCGNSSQMVLG
jgi:hypothetical protein